MLSRFIIDFLPRSKRLLISWLQSPSAVILEPKKIKPKNMCVCVCVCVCVYITAYFEMIGKTKYGFVY